ncbi:MAG: TVP38/TMEM64 family protein [Thermoleophilia bacterium]
MTATRIRLAAAVFWAGTVGGVIVWAVSAGIGAGDAATRLVDAIQGSAWGPVAFVAVYLLRPLLFFSAAVLTVAGGFLFGAPGGVALVVLAANGSAMVAYGLARWFGAGVGSAADPTGRLARWTARLRHRSFESVISMRLLHLPYDLVSYLAGAVRIHPGAFLLGTAVGSLPATVAFVLFGASLESFDGGVPAIDGPVLIASGMLLATGLALSQIMRHRERRRDADA